MISALLAFALWSSLAAGPYQAGFRSSWVLDHSRRYGPEPRGPRPILVELWYPATGQPAAPLLYREYLNFPPLPAHPELPRKLSDLFVGMTPVSLLGEATRACPECTPAAGRFPVIVYFPGSGSGFHEDTVLFEYLASHGYIVLSSAFQSPYPELLTNNTTDTSTSIRDLQMLLRSAAALPSADITRIAGVGHSIGAQYMLEWIGEPDMALDALVSLDSTLEYTPRNFKGHKELRDRLEASGRPRIPVLLFARAADRPNFRTYDEFLAQAPRYETAVRSLKHDDFTLHGAVRRANIAGVREAHDAVCRTILRFLDCQLRNERAACQTIRSEGPITIRYRQPRR